MIRCQPVPLRRRGHALRDFVTFVLGFVIGLVFCRVFGMSGCVSSQYMLPSGTGSILNAIILDNPREVIRLTATDLSLLTWPNIEPFLSSIGAELQPVPPDELDWSAPVSPLISGRLGTRFSCIRWACIVDVVPTEIGPTRAVSLRIRAVLPGSDQEPEVCTVRNFNLMWEWARPRVQAACARAATSLPPGVRFSPAPNPATPFAPNPAPPATSSSAFPTGNPSTRARSRRSHA